MRYALGIVFFLPSWLAVADDRPPVAVPPTPDLIVIEKCKVEYERISTVGAFVLIQASGRIQDCYVHLGSRVKAGQVMGRLHDRDARAEMERLKYEVTDNVEVPLYEARLAQNLVNLNRSRILFQKSMYNRVQLETEELASRAAEFELARAKHSYRGDQLAMAKIEAEVRSREIVAPHDGIVVEILKRVGESTLPNEAVYRMVDPSLLRVTGQVDVKDAWRIHEGQPVRIRLELASVDLPIEREVFTGQITFVDPRIDPETRTCDVVALVNNRDGLLRSGIEARMEIIFEPTPPPAGTVPAPPIARNPGQPPAEGSAPGLPPTGRENSPHSSTPVGKS